MAAFASMSMRFGKRYQGAWKAALLTAVLALCAAQALAQQKPDSSEIDPLLQTPSACPNLTIAANNYQWYAAPPAGYYKSGIDGNCYPLGLCPVGFFWNGIACQAAPLPPVFNIAFAPPAGDVGNPFTLSWTAINTSSITYTCVGPAMPAAGNLLPVFAGSMGGAIPHGLTSCTFTATGPTGLTTVVNATLTGSCPVPLVWNGVACAVAAAPPTLTINFLPAAGNVGDPFSLVWSTTDTTVLSYVCAGPSMPAAGNLMPPGGGAMGGAIGFGATNCTFTATGPGGTVNVVASISGICPAPMVWNGVACAIAAPPGPPVPFGGAPWMPFCQDTLGWVWTGPNDGYWEVHTPVFGRVFGAVTFWTEDLREVHTWNGVAWVFVGNVPIFQWLVPPAAYACP